MRTVAEFVRLNILLPLAEQLKGLRATYWYNQIRKMNTWTKQQVIDWQNQQLRAFVRHAYEHTKYYRELFDSLGLKPIDIQKAEDLQKLPVLTKDTIRTRFSDFVPNNINQLPYREDSTGGTTGNPMKYYVSEDTWGYATAEKMVAWKTTSYKFGDKFVALGSASLFKQKPSLVRRIYDWIRQEIPLNSMSMSDEICQEYIDKMRREKIHYIYGYASSIYLLAKYAYENKVDVSFIKGAFTTSENLTATYRTMIEKTFNCRVMDCYGCRDAGIACYEVRPKKYHVSYNSIIEIVNPIQEGMGTIVSTNILNYAFPLLRYDFGDMVQMDMDDTI
jgi:phenylacetate-CoA ligase